MHLMVFGYRPGEFVRENAFFGVQEQRVEMLGDLPKICATCKALSNRVRLDILRLLQNGSHLLTISEIAQALGIPKTTAPKNNEILFEVNRDFATRFAAEHYKSNGYGSHFHRNLEINALQILILDLAFFENLPLLIRALAVRHFFIH